MVIFLKRIQYLVRCLKFALKMITLISELSEFSLYADRTIYYVLTITGIISVTSVVCSTVAALTTIYRLYIRGGRLWWDDAFAAFSMLVLLVQVASVALHVHDPSKLRPLARPVLSDFHPTISKINTTTKSCWLLSPANDFLCSSLVGKFMSR